MSLLKAPPWFRSFIEAAVEYADLQAEYQLKLRGHDSAEHRFLQPEYNEMEKAADKAWKHFRETLADWEAQG